jgi:hypothetical protein
MIGPDVLAEIIDRLFRSLAPYEADRGETALSGRWVLFSNGGGRAIFCAAQRALRPG